MAAAYRGSTADGAGSDDRSYIGKRACEENLAVSGRVKFIEILTSCLTYNKYRGRIAPIKSKCALENDLQGAFLV